MGTERDWRDEYLKRYYRDWAELWPRLVREWTPHGARVLEIGGGSVTWTTTILRERAKHIVGLDIDTVVRANEYLDDAVVYDGGRFPLPSASFNVAVSRWVNEHLQDPELHFSEVARVLARGGIYLFRTVNLYHYTALGARVIPSKLHVPLVRWLSHVPSDPYPTYYRANTKRRITTIGESVGLTPIVFAISEGPPLYGMAFRTLFHVFMAYERLVNLSGRFEQMRHTIDCVLRKIDCR